MRVEIDSIHERMDRVQEEVQQRQPRSLPNQPRREVEQLRAPRDEGAEEYYIHRGSSSRESQRRPRRVREDRGYNNDNLGGPKFKNPLFFGKNDPDVYLEWEKKVELVFNYQHFTENNNVRMASVEFNEYALVGGISW